MITKTDFTHSIPLTISDQVPSGLWPWQKLTVSILDGLAHKLLIRYIHNRLFSELELEKNQHQVPEKVLEDAVTLMGKSCKTRTRYQYIKLLIAVLDKELVLKNAETSLQWIRNPQV